MLWDLSTGPQLRGVNIYQSRVHWELDYGCRGTGVAGPPYTQEDFNRLSALGANYVNISHPGLFTESPPYILDLEIQANLDSLLEMIAQADMFAVISFRTGPGRSEFTFMLEDVGDWFDESYLNDSVWQDRDAQDAWVAMWRHTASRYKDNPIVAGYDLMVEPNSNEVGSDAISDYLDIWDPDEFYTLYSDSLYDWNQFYPHIVQAIRTVDEMTPVLVGGNGYSSVPWLPYLKLMDDDRIVYTAHQYSPNQFTHQWYDSIKCSYPGRCDINWDGKKEEFDEAYLEELFIILDEFIAENEVPLAVNECGVVRWVPGAAIFMNDQLNLFEARGINYALWMFYPSWYPYCEMREAHNILWGPDPDNTENVSSELLDVILTFWKKNVMRPSTLINQILFNSWIMIQ